MDVTLLPSNLAGTVMFEIKVARGLTGGNSKDKKRAWKMRATNNEAGKTVKS